jgi:hypothetical protein
MKYVFLLRILHHWIAWCIVNRNQLFKIFNNIIFPALAKLNELLENLFVANEIFKFENTHHHLNKITSDFLPLQEARSFPCNSAQDRSPWKDHANHFRKSTHLLAISR